MIRITVNGDPREVPAGTSLGAFLSDLHLPSDGIAVAINQEVIPRATHPQTPLKAGDIVEIIHAVGGG